MAKNKPRKKMTAAQRKALWTKPEANAGVGWTDGSDPNALEQGKQVDRDDCRQGGRRPPLDQLIKD